MTGLMILLTDNYTIIGHAFFQAILRQMLGEFLTNNRAKYN